MATRKVNDNFNVIGNNLAKYRKMRHLSQADLARNLNLLGIPSHKNDISAIEANKRTTRDYEVWGFIRVLNINFEDLFCDVEDKLENDA